MTEYSKMTIDGLMAQADAVGFGPDAMQILKVAEIKLQQEQINLVCYANQLSGKLLLSNEQASKQNDRNAELMNNATQELAKSTKSLNWATWVLVAFTAVQALIALAALFKK
jgi:hypothetical protein